MPSRETSVRAALAALGLAEGADRDAVTHAYRQLARATHPDVSDAPDAAARFAAISAAYRRAIDGAGTPTLTEATAPAAPVTVRHSRTSPYTDPYLRSASPGTIGRPGPIIGLVRVPDAPIVAGPVRVVPSSFDPRGATPDGRRA